jgi:hypothetical protein
VFPWLPIETNGERGLNKARLEFGIVSLVPAPTRPI